MDGSLLGPQDLEARADDAWWASRLDESIDLRRRAYAAYAEAGERRRAARAAWHLSYDFLWKGEQAVASGWMRRAERHLAGEPECAEQGYLALARADAGRARGALADAARLAEGALALGERLGSRDLVAMALQTLGRVRLAEGRIEEGVGMVDDAMCSVIAGELSPLFSGWIYCAALGACFEIADLRRAGEWATAAMRWCEAQAVRSPFQGLCRTYRIEVVTLRGDWDEAAAEAELAVEELRAIVPAAAAAALRALAEVRRRQGRLPEAEEALRRSHELGGDPQPCLALVRLAQGRAAEAARGLASPLVAGDGSALARARTLAARVEIALAAGDPATARAAGAALDDLAEASAAPALEATAATARAAVRLLDDDPAAALRAAGRAWTLWQELGLPYEAACARALLGRALAALGDEERARLELEAARAAFERLGAELDARRVRALLGTRPVGSGDLSRRELEVLRLVASGRTNRQMAEELRLSEHTVSRHLQNIFAKLRVSSRAAATAAAFERGLL